MSDSTGQNTIDVRDLERRLPPSQANVGQETTDPARDRWPLVGERLIPQSSTDWNVEVCGLVRSPRRFLLEELHTLRQTRLLADMHCVTRWTRWDNAFTGVLLSDLLSLCLPLPEARFVSFVSTFSPRLHDTSLSLDTAIKLQTLLALTHDGEPLSPEHGGPVRTITPGRYLYKSLKWVTRIELLAEDRLGFWEREKGYHNNADPWLEQRFIAGNISRSEAESLIQSRDFRGKNLLSISLSLCDLEGLRAENAEMRNSDFTGANLRGADFTGANLTLARLDNADLRGASFRNTDLEGVHLEGADLRGVDFTGASLVGTTFCTGRLPGDNAFSGGALFNHETIIPEACLSTIDNPDQSDYVRQAFQGSAPIQER